MSDDADFASELNEQVLNAALKNFKNNNKPIPFSGKCLSCDEPLTKGRYCDSECRDEHEARTRKRF